MRLGIRAHDVAGNCFEEIMENVGKQGYPAIQLAIYKAVKPEEFSTDKDALTPGLAMYMKEVLDQNHVEVSVLGCYKELGMPDQEVMADTIDTYKKFIRFASYMGAGLVGTETGTCGRPDAKPYYQTEEALERYIHDLKEVVDYAEKMGVIVAIEPVKVHIVGDTKKTRRVLDEIHSPNLQLIYDPVGLLDKTNYENREAIWEEFQEVCGKEIAAIHVKDFVIKDGDVVNVPCGMGEIKEYKNLLKFVKEKKPYIHVILEDTKPENASVCKKLLEDTYAALA